MGDFLSVFFSELPSVGSGLWVTVEATVLGALLAVAVAFACGLAATSRARVPRWTSRIVVEFFRGTSLYIQLFWLYYAFPLLTGYEFGPLVCGVLAFGLNYGAYGSEVVRGALAAVPAPQREAAVALNFTPLQRLYRVVLPQAWPQMIPPFTNLLIQMLKATPLLWLISVADLTTVVQTLRDRTGETVPAYLTLLVLYFVLAWLLTAGMRVLERHAAARLGRTSMAVSGGRS
ncbi:ectoine/hydroxyectoine ABC transporter permease subunit EhuC [Streptomyces niveiscabiei]|uniref:ectoine/hydroxyectoine ABC transporter permease subunit EhuC n=1 Tax=Streptomyces niveiscabiei TaxID=164115 RepID=UPI0029B9DA90|nr:ectoine/hydroxyectoine ABC transporter permease subunit EhuC [Streptomyces niveiscabiei]MDX3386065.1 ectoine/hydroxyectoine ABC transporter permease subunit EhuC [Streptomyces niveiscabiei]